MCDIARCRIEELEKFVMPALLVATAEDPAMVAVTNQGYAITWQGIAELERRGIPHRGAEVVVGGHEKLDFGTWDSDGFGAKRHADQSAAGHAARLRAQGVFGVGPAIGKGTGEVSHEQGLSSEDLAVPHAAAHRAGTAAGRLCHLRLLRMDRILPDEERPMNDDDRIIHLPRFPTGTPPRMLPVASGSATRPATRR